VVCNQLPYPFALPSDVAEQRNLLESFYNNMGSAFSADDDRWSPWKMASSGAIGHIVSGCIFPERTNRWPSFHRLRQFFESKFPHLMQSSVQSVVDGSDYLHRKALSLYKVGRLSDALNTFNSALINNPADADLWRDAAIVLSDLRMKESAIDFLSHATSLNPNVDISHPAIAQLSQKGRSV